MQYKVPQNVDIEDKVIGGLTLRQFMFLIIAGGIDLMLYVSLKEGLSFLFMPLAIVIGGMGAALAFLKINERPFEFFLISLVKTFFSSKNRVWQKEINVAPEEHKPVTKKEEPTRKKDVSEIRSNLERLAMVVDSGSHNLTEDRTTNVKASEVTESAKVKDLLEEAEKPSERLEKFIKQAKSITRTQKEQTIGEMATVKADKNTFEYQDIELSNEKELEEMLKITKQKQMEKEKELESAKINKFTN